MFFLPGVVGNYWKNNHSNSGYGISAVSVTKAEEKQGFGREIYSVRDLFMREINHHASQWWCDTAVTHTISHFIFSPLMNIHLSLCRPPHSDAVHRAAIRPGGRESHLHLPGHCQPSYHGLQVQRENMS